MSERIIEVGDLELWTESFGDPDDETILLIMGPGSGLLWPDYLCDALVDGGRRVIRYDHRDTGTSTTVDFDEHPYTLSNLAADAVGVLDAYGTEKAHLVGMSGGGLVAQTVALEHPERTTSLTSWGSTPLARSWVGAGDSDLPGPDPKITEAMVAAGQATNDEERIEGRLAVARVLTGSLEPFDEGFARDFFVRIVAHTRDHAAFMNHWMAFAASPDRTEMLASLDVPTLVIHGTEDPIVLLAHGEATAKAIPSARLLTIEGMGHDFPRAAMPEIVPAILEHTGQTRASRQTTVRPR